MRRILPFALAVAAFAQAGPEAFVPGLRPRVRTEPVYPEASRERGHQGTVRVLVSLDPEGRVSAAEVLYGPEVFRAAALDAIRQWRFHPVMRDGHAVAAYTEQAVLFYLPGKSFLENNLDPKSTAEMAPALARLRALQQRFPRSHRQVFLDLARDVEGIEGRNRIPRLYEIGRAAVAAGEFDRAKAAGEELLRAAALPDLPSFFEAAHGGNTLLGLVALQRGDVDAARRYLLASGRAPAGPVLRSFGPSMSLAQALLERNERGAVLEYFKLCAVFWTNPKLPAWEEAVREGGAPDFGFNLVR